MVPEPSAILRYREPLDRRKNICNGAGVIDHETRFAYDGNQIILQFDKDCDRSFDVRQDNPMTDADLSHRYLWQPDAVDQLMADEQITNSGVARQRGFAADRSMARSTTWQLPPSTAPPG